MLCLANSVSRITVLNSKFIFSLNLTWRLGPFRLLTEHHNSHVCVSYKQQKCVSRGSEGRTSPIQEPGAQARAPGRF